MRLPKISAEHKIIFTIIITAFVFFFVGYFTCKRDVEIKHETQFDTVYVCCFDTLNVERLFDYIISKQIKHPEIVCKQALLETGNFTSNVFKKCNNLFGFRTKNGYLYFDNWKKSVDYYANWQKRRYKSGNYYDFLNKVGYAEDSLYVHRLRQIVLKL